MIWVNTSTHRYSVEIPENTKTGASSNLQFRAKKKAHGNRGFRRGQHFQDFAESSIEQAGVVRAQLPSAPETAQELAGLRLDES